MCDSIGRSFGFMLHTHTYRFDVIRPQCIRGANIVKELGKADTNDINNMNCARQDKSNTERMTQLSQSIPELYEEEVDNSTQQRNANVAIVLCHHNMPHHATRLRLKNDAISAKVKFAQCNSPMGTLYIPCAIPTLLGACYSVRLLKYLQAETQSKDTHKTPYDRVKRCRERKKKKSRRPSVSTYTYSRKQMAVSPTKTNPIISGMRRRKYMNFSRCSGKYEVTMDGLYVTILLFDCKLIYDHAISPTTPSPYINQGRVFPMPRERPSPHTPSNNGKHHPTAETSCSTGWITVLSKDTLLRPHPSPSQTALDMSFPETKAACLPDYLKALTFNVVKSFRKIKYGGWNNLRRIIAACVQASNRYKTPPQTNYPVVKPGAGHHPPSLLYHEAGKRRMKKLQASLQRSTASRVARGRCMVEQCTCMRVACNEEGIHTTQLLQILDWGLETNVVYLHAALVCWLSYPVRKQKQHVQSDLVTTPTGMTATFSQEGIAPDVVTAIGHHWDGTPSAWEMYKPFGYFSGWLEIVARPAASSLLSSTTLITGRNRACRLVSYFIGIRLPVIMLRIPGSDERINFQALQSISNTRSSTKLFTYLKSADLRKENTLQTKYVQFRELFTVK
ncbi:hypothetical protein PR048_003429 [Dryococelus australis]|uniref:Uncharacterized protein n=1 Tax=Dryococelus australis TaxID=614101 RepID=A0ABQ9IN33_9NEOP|nr:hypothetical protein PR048_003429 [Dryococelus australis]